jgi:hypothetical protein
MRKQELIPEESVVRKIYLIRGQKVMSDMDLAELYGIETKNLKKAVRRNLQRFPEDFIFELTVKELGRLRFQIGTSKNVVAVARDTLQWPSRNKELPCFRVY